MSGGGSGDKDPTDGAENIRVAVRCRPLNARERSEGANVIFKREGSSTVLLSDPASGANAPRRFAFDFVYDDKAEQHELFRDVGSPILDRAFAGFNGTIFAYGQTGSGKTWSMNGAPTPASRGLIPRMNEALFARVARETAASARKRFLVVCSFFEIYNEIIYDLLATGGDDGNGADAGFSTRGATGATGGSKGRGLEIKEHPLLGVYVKGLQEVVVDSNERIEELMTRGQAQRSVGATMMNADSSRSHSVFVIKVHQKLEKTKGDAADGASGGEEEEGNIFAKVNLVDLAGSERADRTGAAGARLREGANINKSLAALGNVINGLVAKARAEQTRSGKSVFIPYRDSKLTRVLQESLGGNALCTMVATLSPAASSFSESLSTLQYASRAKSVTVKAVRNEGKSSETRLQEEIRQLKAKLAKAQAGNAIGAGGGLLGGAQPSSVGQGMEEAAQARKQAARYRAQIEEMEAMAQQSWEDKQKESQKYDAELKRAESERREAETRVLLERERRWEALCAQGEPEVTLKEVEAELLRSAAKAQGEHDSSDASKEVSNAGGRRNSKAEQLHNIRKRQAEASTVGRRLRSLRAIKRQVREQRGLTRLFARAFEGELAKWRSLRLTSHAQHVVPASSPNGNTMNKSGRTLTELEEARERALVEQVRGKLAALEQEAKKLGELEERHASTARSLAASWTSLPPPAAPGSPQPETCATEGGSASRVELILAQQLTELARNVRQGTRTAMTVLCRGDATSPTDRGSPAHHRNRAKLSNKGGTVEESGEAAVICIRRAAISLIDSISALNCAGGGTEGGQATMNLSTVLGVDPPVKKNVRAADVPNDDRFLTFADGSKCSLSLVDEDETTRGTYEILREAPADGWFKWSISSYSSLPSSLRVAMGSIERVRAVDVLVGSEEATSASHSVDGQPDTTWKLCGSALRIHNGGGWKALLGTEQQAPIVRLLQRPPVRFVHDLVVALRKAIEQGDGSAAANFAPSAIQAVATPAAPPDVAQPKDQSLNSPSTDSATTDSATADSCLVAKSPHSCETHSVADAKTASPSSAQSLGQAKSATKQCKNGGMPEAKRQSKPGSPSVLSAERLKSKAVRRRFITSLITDLQQQLSMDAPADRLPADFKAQLDSISADDVVAGRDCHGANVLLQFVGLTALCCSKFHSTATNQVVAEDAMPCVAMEPAVATDELGSRFYSICSDGRTLRRGDRASPIQWPLHRGDSEAAKQRLWLGNSDCEGVDARHLMLRLTPPTPEASSAEGAISDRQMGVSLRIRILLGATMPKQMAVNSTSMSSSSDLGDVLANVSSSMAGVWEELRDAEARRWRDAAAARGARIRELERRAAAAAAESERAGEATKEVAILRAQLRDAKAEVAAANAAAAASAAEALDAMNAKEAAEIEAKQARDAATAAKEAVANATKQAVAIEMSDRAKAASPVFCADDPAAASELAQNQSLAQGEVEAKIRAEVEAKDAAHAIQLNALRDQLRQALSRAEASEIELAAAGGRAAAATEEADVLLSKLQAAENAVAAARREKAEAEAVAAAAEAQAEAAEARRAEALLVTGRPQPNLSVDAKTHVQPTDSAPLVDTSTSQTDTRPAHESGEPIISDDINGPAAAEHSEDEGDEYGDQFDEEVDEEQPGEAERAAENGVDTVDDVQDDTAAALQARAQAARAASRLADAEEQLETIREEAAAATVRATEAEEIVEEQKVLMRELWEQVEVAMEERDVSRTKEEELFAEVTEKDDEIEALKYAVQWLKSQVNEKEESKEDQNVAKAGLALASTQLLDAQDKIKRADERADRAHELVQQERAEVERLKLDMQGVQTQLQRLYGYATSEAEGVTNASASAAELCTKLLQIYSAHYGTSDDAHYANNEQHESVQQSYAQQQYYEHPQHNYVEASHTEPIQQTYAQSTYYEQSIQPIDAAGIAAGSAMNAVAVHRGSIPG